jgi:hypothetical protein
MRSAPSSCRRIVPRLAAGLAASLAAAFGLATTATPAWAATDGKPVVTSVAPQSGPTSGGTPVRIYGSGFLGVTSVKFGAKPATKFAVIDGRLLTAVAPAAAANNTSVDVVVTDSQGTGTGTNNGNNTGFYYTNAKLTVTPATGLHPGQAVTVSTSGYKANVGVVIPELNPLLLYLEGGPDFPPGPPPYTDPLSFPSTNGSGAVSATFNLSNPFNSDGVSYDRNAVCPPNQVTANFLGNSPSSPTRDAYSAKCLMALTQFAIGTIDKPISFSTDPVPAPPVLKLSKTSANQGDTVSIAAGSVNWNANPFFGSATVPSKPGQTKVTIQICGIGGSATHCSTTAGTGAVALTRYKSTSTGTPITGVFSGATLSGTIKVGADIPNNCTTCFVKVQQFRPVGGGSIQATAPLKVT